MPLSTDLTDALIPEDGSRISNGGPAQGRQAITEIVEPFAGRLLDPASGSGAMYVQSARFVRAHRGKPAVMWAWRRGRPQR